jgi:hypothetical protein
MRQMVAVLLVGAALGSGTAAAATDVISIPSGSSVIVRDPRQDGTYLRFEHLDVACIFQRASPPLPPEDANANEVMLLCARTSNWNRSAALEITPYRIYVWTSARKRAYVAATRTP